MNARKWFEQEVARVREAEERAIAARETQAREAEERAALLAAEQRDAQRQIEAAHAAQLAQEMREREAQEARIREEGERVTQREAERQLEIETARLERERLEQEKLERERIEAEYRAARAAEAEAERQRIAEVQAQAQALAEAQAREEQTRKTQEREAESAARAAERAIAEAKEREEREERNRAIRDEAARLAAARQAEREAGAEAERQRLAKAQAEAKAQDEIQAQTRMLEEAARAEAAEHAAAEVARRVEAERVTRLESERLEAERLAAEQRVAAETERQDAQVSSILVAESDTPNAALLEEVSASTFSEDSLNLDLVAEPEVAEEPSLSIQSELESPVEMVAAEPLVPVIDAHERNVLLGVADLHCHLLPAWDDGARDLETALEMVRRAGMWGCEAIVVTPHVGKNFTFKLPTSLEIGAAVAALQEKVVASSQKMRLVPGAEIALSSPVLLERILTEPELSVGGLGRHALIEPPGQDWPDWMEMVALQMLQGGITPILAHPERFAAIQRNPALLERLVNTGALVQITADAIAGHMGRNAKRCADALFDLGLVALIASDAHDARATQPSEVADDVKHMVGFEAARRILRDNPLAILAGEVAFAPAITPPVVEEAPRGLLSGLWSRH